MSNFSKNKLFLVGHVGGEPKVYQDEKGQPKFAAFSIATNKHWKQDNQKMQKTTWHNLLLPKHKLSLIEYINKGDLLDVEGELTNREVTAKSGETFTVTTIVVNSIGFLSKKSNGSGRNSRAAEENIEECINLLNSSKAA